MSKTIDTALQQMFLLIIANFIFLWLFLLLTIVANFLIAIRQENNNGHPRGSYTVEPPGHWV